MDKMRAVIDLVGKLQKTSEDGAVSRDVLFKHLREKWRMSDMEISKLLATASRDTLIYQPTPGFYKLV